MRRRNLLFIAAILVAAVLAGFSLAIISPSKKEVVTRPPSSANIQTMGISSPSFRNGERIPSRYTCDGENTSPPLAWKASSERTGSYALIVEDPDAPSGTFTHWVIFNVPPASNGLQEGVRNYGVLDDGSVQGRNDLGKIGYGGPCPPSGVHRYRFHIYALDSKLNLPSGVSKEEVLKAIEGRILAQAEMAGLYGRG